MSTPSEVYLKNVPTRRYDLLKELAVILAVVMVVVIILAAVLGSPDYPTITGASVANQQPITYLQTCANILAGNASMQDYGPPYNADTTNSQRLFGFIAPSDWVGVTIPVDPQQDYIIKPLKMVSIFSLQLAQAVSSFQQATADQQNTWTSNYLAALDNATATNETVNIPDGDYGPVPVMMDAMLLLGKSGLLERALESNSQTPYSFNPANPLLFFQDDVLATAADTLDLTGPQWGIEHETGNFPGAWWLFPYAIWYHIPPMSTSPVGDIEVGAIMIILFLLLLLLPLIPGLNRIPQGLRVYRLIWKDWYGRREGEVKS